MCKTPHISKLDVNSTATTTATLQNVFSYVSVAVAKWLALLPMAFFCVESLCYCELPLGLASSLSKHTI